MKFYQKKFRQLEKNRKNRILIKFIKSIEDEWENEKNRVDLLREFRNCLSWSEHLDSIQIIESLANDISRKVFLDIIVPLERILSRDVTDKDILVFQEDGTGVVMEKMPVVIILHNIRSVFNIGSIFRTSDCLGIEKIYLSGYSATPEHPRLQETAMGTEKKVEWEKVEDPFRLMNELKKKGYEIYALETADKAEIIYDAKLNFPCCLILGNEALGINEDLLETSDKIIKLPVRGWKNSLNVGVAFAVCGYELLRMWEGWGS